MPRDQVDDIVGELAAMVEDSVKGLSRELTLNLTAATPKDTGLAARSWIPSAGRPAPPVAVGQRTPAGVRAAAEAQEAGLAELKNYNLGRGPVVITNGQTYVLSLNDGHSRQAPSAFVQRTIVQTVRRGPRTRSRS